ncbi:MAG: hypothetical protein EZS28_018289 [Streblomastix strix]|uniref:Uncharacterized protein n=1 Tax=Streblomastix strix TaxID=222440 RepID=A0A5J4VUP0_9EUKA|nr:MAG: hypothetical protein EZS28_018289 [Streblomastix strix]
MFIESSYEEDRLKEKEYESIINFDIDNEDDNNNDKKNEKKSKEKEKSKISIKQNNNSSENQDNKLDINSELNLEIIQQRAATVAKAESKSVADSEMLDFKRERIEFDAGQLHFDMEMDEFLLQPATEIAERALKAEQEELEKDKIKDNNQSKEQQEQQNLINNNKQNESQQSSSSSSYQSQSSVPPVSRGHILVLASRADQLMETIKEASEEVMSYAAAEAEAERLASEALRFAHEQQQRERERSNARQSSPQPPTTPNQQQSQQQQSKKRSIGSPVQQQSPSQSNIAKGKENITKDNEKGIVRRPSPVKGKDIQQKDNKQPMKVSDMIRAMADEHTKNVIPAKPKINKKT